MQIFVVGAAYPIDGVQWVEHALAHFANEKLAEEELQRLQNRDCGTYYMRSIEVEGSVSVYEVYGDIPQQGCSTLTLIHTASSKAKAEAWLDKSREKGNLSSFDSFEIKESKLDREV